MDVNSQSETDHARQVIPRMLHSEAETVSGIVMLLLGPPVGTKRHFPAGQETAPDSFGKATFWGDRQYG